VVLDRCGDAGKPDVILGCHGYCVTIITHNGCTATVDLGQVNFQAGILHVLDCMLFYQWLFSP
jgi:hypothetical protein